VNGTMPARLALVVSVALACAGCASTWSRGSVERSTQQEATAAPATSVAKVTLSESDITNRKYTSLGDITVQVNKLTLFHSDPTPEQVNEKLREKAAELGADAVVLVRYGKVGISALSYGSLEGKGRAVKFQ
jgi:uncharacterized protein YbjQ (UPF0145 family)